MASARKSRKRVLVVDDDKALNHVLTEMLSAGGYEAKSAGDGIAAIQRLERDQYDLVLLDINLPKLSGLDVLKQIRERRLSPRVIVMTGDDTPDTILGAVRDQAYQYIAKPAAPKTIVDVVEEALNKDIYPIEVISATHDWVELLVPCQIESAGRVQSFLAPLNANLPEDIRDSVGQAFHELVMNAIEWGGRFDPQRKVRIACIRARRMLLYRIQDPGPGFNPKNLLHAAVSNAPEKPYAHLDVREQKNIRPGGFGLLMARAMVDELIYNEVHNEVIFVKYLG
jgi:two-component system, OmpR family, response regulator